MGRVSFDPSSEIGLVLGIREALRVNKVRRLFYMSAFSFR